ncbi:hypothetical protein QUF70_16025 [Desulfobacterales bacterium HSG17]|nr:hypothetical protein [Desulfobacterales bacterium HSG17]
MQEIKDKQAETDFEEPILDFEALFSSEDTDTKEPDTDFQKPGEFSSSVEKQEKKQDAYPELKPENKSDSKSENIPENTIDKSEFHKAKREITHAENAGYDNADINELILNYLNLKHKQTLINTRVKDIEQKIELAVKEHGANIMETDFAEIEMVKDKPVLRIKYEYNLHNR